MKLDNLKLSTPRVIMLTANQQRTYHQRGRIDQVEHIQGFAARLATGRWSEDRLVLCSELGWCPLVTRRQYQRISLCRRIVSGKSIIPCSVFTPECFIRNSRHTKNKVHLKQQLVHADYIKSSFFVKTPGLWNEVPGDIVGLNSDTAFKQKLRDHLSIT